MPSYHLSVQIVKRSEGRSVIAMAAYRAGEQLRDIRRGVDVDYSRKRGITHAEVMAPAGSAEWLRDREALWNAVEAGERRKDAQLAREINIALPHELSHEQRLELVRRFVGEQFVARGMVADVALHHPVADKGDDPRNFHAHILLTLRQAGEHGLRPVKTREWNSDSLIVAWRAAWAECQNAALERAGLRARVDHRSLAAQRSEAVTRGDLAGRVMLERAPEIHVGPKARKAGRASAPASRDRAVGPVRKDFEGKRTRRQVKYSAIDKGSRGAWNIARLKDNARAFGVAGTKTMQRLARLNGRLRHYERKIRQLESRQTVGAASEEVRRRIAHARKRKLEVLWLIDQLDILFRSILGIRESQLVRQTVWSNRLRRWRVSENESLRQGGRVRPRGPFD